MPTVNNIAQTVEDSVAAAETLRLELERYRSELGECRKRMGELEQGEALLAGEKRILEMIAKSSPLEPILDALCRFGEEMSDRKSTRLNSSHSQISYAVFCLKKKKKKVSKNK